MTLDPFEGPPKCQCVGCGCSTWPEAVLVGAEMVVNHGLDSIQYHLVNKLRCNWCQADSSIFEP